MRFYGNGIVWDAEKDCKLMKFAGGVFDTEDQQTIRLLVRNGYRHDEVSSAPPQAEAPPEQSAPPDALPESATADLNVAKLREIGKQRGLAFKFGTSKEQMVTAINKTL
jgi:hypothetical protein